MHYTIEQLSSGVNVEPWFRAARNLWSAIVTETGLADVESLARRISSEQMSFEAECGGRFIGQEIMAWTGIAFYYTTAIGYEGHEQEAATLYNALMRSACSMEVHHHATEAARSYDLTEA